MHKNTLLLVSILAVCAALLIGVNIGKGLQKSAATPTPASPTGGPTPASTTQTYLDTFCGFSLSYPSTFTVLENASGSAILNSPADKTQSITLTCQKGIPRPALPSDKIETFVLPDSSVSATLYHDSSAKDGTPIDVVIFRHPTNRMDGFVAGYGEAFTAAIKTLKILP